MDFDYVKIDISKKETMDFFYKFYNEVLVPNFIPDELETIEQFEERLHDRNENYNYYIYVILNKNEDVLGGVVFDYIVKNNVGFIEYIATNSKFKRHGVGSFCLNLVTKILNNNAMSHNMERVQFICGEVQKESDCKQSKHFFWDKFGFKKLDFSYIQPALDDNKEDVTNMDFGIMTKFPNAEFNKDFIDSDMLISLLFDYYSDIESDTYDVLLNMKKEISSKGEKIHLINRDTSLNTISFTKTYQDDFYIMIPLTGNISYIEDIPDNLGTYYTKTVNEFSNYECNSAIAQSLNRHFLGRIPLGCIDDYDTKEVIQKQDAYLFLTSHNETDLHILTVLVPNEKMSTTMLQDQASSDNLYVFHKNIWTNIYDYIRQIYNLEKCGEPKTIVCLSNEPKDKSEIKSMLAGEAYEGEYTTRFDNNYLTSKKLEELSKNDISQYAFSKCYASDVSILYVLKNFGSEFSENLKYEALILFIVELVMFQHSAINRINNKIVNDLSIDGNVSLKFIENLYTEFGKTVIFWNSNNFYYSTSQNLADAIYKNFKTHECFETYKRNQDFLEHIVDLKNAQSTNRENKILNIIVIILTCLQVIPVIINFINWFISKENALTFISLSGGSLTLLIIIILILLKRRNNKA